MAKGTNFQMVVTIYGWIVTSTVDEEAEKPVIENGTDR
jgi:hypothetical protein